MEVQKTHLGFSDEELKALPGVYRADLFSGKTVVVPRKITLTATTTCA